MGCILSLHCFELVSGEPKAPGDVAQVTPGTKVVKVTKKVVKRSGRIKTPTSAKDVTMQIPKSGESVKAKVEESQEKEDVEEAAVENVGESGKNEETLTEAGEPVVENAGDSARKVGTVVEVEETVVESAVEVEEAVAENIGESAKKEESAMEVKIAVIANVGDSLRREEPVVAEVAKSVEDEEADGAKDGEEVMEEKEEDARDVGNKEEPNVEPVNMGENVIEDFRGEDAQLVKEFGSDEAMEDYGDRVDLGEHGEDELVEDDPEEPAEYDPEEPAEYTEALEEECRELTAVAKERKIKKEHEIFVGGLDRDAEEEDVRKVFERIGEVVEVRLHKDPSTNKNKGYAFVKFANKEHAKRALSEMKNPVVCNYSYFLFCTFTLFILISYCLQIHGKRCGTAPSEDNDSLFLGNICNTWTKEAVGIKELVFNYFFS